MANKKLIVESDLPVEFKALGLLMCIAQQKYAELTRQLNPMNLSLLQLNILHGLSMAPEGSLTVNQIKSLQVDESPNISRALNKLMERGLIVKKRSQEDQRVVRITITEAGLHAHKDGDALLIGATLGLSKEDTKKLYGLLAKIE